MASTRLNTKQLANRVINNLDTYRGMEVINSSLFTKLTSFSVLIDAINNADIEVCGAIKQDTQVIIYVPAGETEVFLSSSDLDASTHSNAIIGLTLPDSAKAVFLNDTPWRQVGQIRSETIYVFDDYPIKEANPTGKLFLRPFTSFQGKKYISENYSVDISQYEGGNIGWYDAARMRLQINTPYTANKYISFEAYLFPEKINYDDIDAGDYDAYSICAPDFAMKALMYQVLVELLPPGLDMTNELQTLAILERKKVIARAPRNHSILTVDPNF